MRCLQALANVFDVPAGYLLDEQTAAQPGRDREVLAALRDDGARAIALGVRGLSRESRDMVLKLVRHLGALEPATQIGPSPGHGPGCGPDRSYS
jgi:hypothetical protein